MSVQRTESGIRYDTAVKEVRQTASYPTATKKIGSGDAKLAAYREGQSSSPSGTVSISQSPRTDISPQAQTQRTDLNEQQMKQAISDRYSSPFYYEFRAAAEEKETKPVQTQPPANLSDPHSMGSDVTARTNITIRPREEEQPQNLSLMDTVRLSLSDAVERGTEKAEGVTMSKGSQRLIQAGDSVVEKAQQYREVAPILYPTDPIKGRIAPAAMESGADALSILSRAPGGAEVFAQRPSLIPTAAVVAGLGMVDYTVSTAKDDPLKLGTDIAVFSLLGAGAGKAGAVVKSKTPALGWKSTPQEFLVKGKIPDSKGAKPVDPTPIKQAEYQGSMFGQDSFKISDLQLQVSSPKAAGAGAEVLIGKSKGGFTDVYFKADKSTAQQLSKSTFGTIENIRTPEGRFMVFDPAGPIQNPTIPKTPHSRVGTQSFEQIGKQPGRTGAQVESPFRIEKRVDLQKATLQSSEAPVALPEFTRTVDARGKTVQDFNVRDYYKEPIFRDPLQLDSGLVKQKRSFFGDETATLKPRTEYKPKSQYIGEMPDMQTRYLRFAEPVDSPLANVMKADLQTILRREPPKGQRQPHIDSRSTPDTGRIPFLSDRPGTSRGPFLASSPGFLRQTQPGTIAQTSPRIDRSLYPSFERMRDPFPDPFARSSRPGPAPDYPVRPPAVQTRTPPPALIEEMPHRRSPKAGELLDPFGDYGRYAKKWRNPVLTGYDIIGLERGRR
jgi:hypothetical protein